MADINGEGRLIGNYRDWRRFWHGVERTLTLGGWPARMSVGFGMPLHVGVELHEVGANHSLGGSESLRIGFASDFHAGPSTPRELIERSITELGRLAPDVLLLGGDFVSLRAEYARPLAADLAAIPARLGRYAVLGNHDHWSGAAGVASILEDAGIHVLTNRNVRLPAPFDHVSICGLDDHTSGDPDADAAFADTGPVRVVLMHAPSNLLDVGDRDFTVAICGHTHGGQIALPGGRPLKVAHGPLSRRYNAGRFDVGNGRVLLVSRGIGCSTVPLRMNAPPAVMRCVVRGRDG